MSKNVMLTAAVADRAGVDEATASKVLAATFGLMRDMALQGQGMKLEGVGRFVLNRHPRSDAHATLGFEPVGKLKKMTAAAGAGPWPFPAGG